MPGCELCISFAYLPSWPTIMPDQEAYAQAIIIIVLVPIWVIRFQSYCDERWVGGWVNIGTSLLLDDAWDMM